MDAFDAIWDWLPLFTKGDLPSWIAVAIAVIAVIFAIRKPPIHTELRLTRLHFDSDGGPIDLELELTTYSHAPRLNTHAKLKLDGINYPINLEPITWPTNYAFATVNTFQLRFEGQYKKSQTTPKTASIDVKARLSDGSRARLRDKMQLVENEDPILPSPDTEESQQPGV